MPSTTFECQMVLGRDEVGDPPTRIISLCCLTSWTIVTTLPYPTKHYRERMNDTSLEIAPLQYRGRMHRVSNNPGRTRASLTIVTRHDRVNLHPWQAQAMCLPSAKPPAYWARRRVQTPAASSAVEALRCSGSEAFHKHDADAQVSLSFTLHDLQGCPASFSGQRSSLSFILPRLRMWILCSRACRCSSSNAPCKVKRMMSWWLALTEDTMWCFHAGAVYIKTLEEQKKSETLNRWNNRADSKPPPITSPLSRSVLRSIQICGH